MASTLPGRKDNIGEHMNRLNIKLLEQVIIANCDFDKASTRIYIIRSGVLVLLKFGI